MLFDNLFRHLIGGSQLKEHRLPHRPKTRGGNAASSRRFVPQLTVLEDRELPSVSSLALGNIAPPAKTLAAAQQQLPFKETLTVVGVSETGVISYTGHGTHVGKVDAVLNPDNTFVKTAANGDKVFGFVTHATEATGTVTITGGTGRFADATGSSTYVISANPKTGVTTVEITGSICYDASGQAGPQQTLNAASTDTHTIPFKVNGSGPAPQGVPLFPGGTAPHLATGMATHLGKYTGTGEFTLLSFTSPTTGTFTGYFEFVAANGDVLRMNYGAEMPGSFEVFDAGDGEVYVVFDAIFTPDSEHSTGRFQDITGGSFRMIATTQPFVLQPDAQVPYTAPFIYSWVGEGTLEFGKKK